jgi:hemolysin D
MESPPHPAPRIVAITISALLAATLSWAALSKVDTYATAPGKVIPKGRVQVIQAEETSRVSAIYVKDGQHVQMGDPLIDLDNTETDADTKRIKSDLMSAQVEAARSRALLDAVDHGGLPILEPIAMLSPGMRITEERVLNGTISDVRSNQAKLRADIAQARASKAQVAEEILKIEKTLPIEERKEEDYAQLIKRGFVGKHDYYNEQQAVIQQRQDLSEQRAKASELVAAQSSAEEKLASYSSSQRRGWLDALHESELKVGELTQELVKAERRGAVRHLTAPMSGTVEQLAVHTVGGVVTSAQAVLNLVPDAGGIEVEAIVNNRDVGFVKPGQEAEVKVETFPYARFGLLHGTVTQIADDARQDEKLGLIFAAQVDLQSEDMYISGRRVRLKPGMAVTVEIRTGRQRVLSFLMSPLIQNVRESFHER